MSYIGNSPGVASQRVESAFTATSSQTVFTPSSGYTLGYCDVYQNGVKLVNGDDYTASDGVTVTLATGAASGDSIVIVASFPRGLSDGYLKSEADAKYALIASPTFTGVATFAKGTSNGITIGDVSTNSNSVLRLHGTSAGRNWQIANNLNVAGIEFTPSTANGGTTYTTPTVTFLSSGNVGVGTTSPSARLHVSTSGTGIQEVEWLNNAQAVGADVGSALVFTGTSSNNGLARISGAFSGATTADGAYMAFSTRAVTSGTLTERVRLDAAGSFLVGDTSNTTGSPTFYVKPKNGLVSQLAGFNFCSTSASANPNNNLMITGGYYDGSSSVATQTSATTYQQATGSHYWYSNTGLTAGNAYSSTERMRLDTSGRLGIGATSLTFQLEVAGSVRSQSGAFVLSQGTTNTGSMAPYSLIAGSGTDYSTTVFAETGRGIYFCGNGSATRMVTIDTSGFLSVGASNPVAAMLSSRRASGGQAFYAGQVVATNDTTAIIEQTVGGGNGSQNIGLIVRIQAWNNADRILNCQFYNNGSPQDKMYVQRDGSSYNATGVWGTISDARVKQDITDASSQWEDFKKIKFRKFRMIDDVEALADAAPYLMGPVAQELEEAGMNGLVETPTQVDGTELNKQVKLSIMYMKGMKALQEALLRIEQLEADVATLKGTP